MRDGYSENTFQMLSLQDLNGNAPTQSSSKLLYWMMVFVMKPKPEITNWPPSAFCKPFQIQIILKWQEGCSEVTLLVKGGCQPASLLAKPQRHLTRVEGLLEGRSVRTNVPETKSCELLLKQKLGPPTTTTSTTTTTATTTTGQLEILGYQSYWFKDTSKGCRYTMGWQVYLALFERSFDNAGVITPPLLQKAKIIIPAPRRLSKTQGGASLRIHNL